MKLSVFGRPAFVGTASLLLSLSTHAALTAVDLDGNPVNGHEGVYDDVLDITWLANANLADTNTFGVSGIASSGRMTWRQAELFVTAMNNSNGGDGYLGVDAWRQSIVTPVDGNTLNMTSSTDGSTDNGYQITAPIDPNYNPNGQSANFTGNELAYHYYNNFSGIGRSADCSGGGFNGNCTFASSEYGIDDAPDPENNKALFSNIEKSNYWSGAALNLAQAFVLDFDWGNQRTWDKGFTQYVWAVAPGNVAANAVPIPTAAWLFGSALVGLIAVRRKHS